jgi:BTB/POZ domain
MDFSEWYMNPMLSDILIVNKVSGEKIYAHGLALSKNPYFKQILDSHWNGSPILKKNGESFTIEVSNIRVAKFLIKIIYTNTLDRSYYIMIDLKNSDDVTNLLDYVKMWLFDIHILNQCMLFISTNFEFILANNFDLIPTLTTHFIDIDSQSIYYNTRLMFIEKIGKIFETKTDLPIEILDWKIIKYITAPVILELISTLDDPTIMYNYHTKFEDCKIKRTSIINKLVTLDVEKINIFYDLLDNINDKKSLVLFYQLLTVRSLQPIISEEDLIQKLGLKNISILRSVCHITKELDLSEIKCDKEKILILERIYPFKATLYTNISHSQGYELNNRGIVFSPKIMLYVGDKIFYEYETHEITEILYGRHEVKQTVAYPCISYLFILKNPSIKERKSINIINVYSISNIDDSITE